MLKLNEKELIHNNGSDIWDYMFESQPLPRTFKAIDDMESENGMDWYDEGIEWLTDELLDGEVFEIFEESATFAYTSMGRHANIKKKKWRKLSMQGNSLAGNMSGGAFSLSKLIKERWNIDIDYRTLPYEVTQHIVTNNASQALRQWIKDNE